MQIRRQIRPNIKPSDFSNFTLADLAYKTDRQTNTFRQFSAVPILCLAASLSFTSTVTASDFHFELNASATTSNLSLEPGVAFGAKASAYDLWFSGEYLIQSGLENSDVLGESYDSNAVVLKSGYDWYLEENMAFTPYAGFAMTFDDIEFDPSSGQNGFLFESGAWQIFGGLSVTLKLNESFLFTAGAAFMPGYDRDESQTLLSFTLSWRPFAGFGSTPPPTPQPQAEAPVVDESPFEPLPESSSEFDDMAGSDEPESSDDVFVDLETFDDPEPAPRAEAPNRVRPTQAPAPARAPSPSRTPATARNTSPPPSTRPAMQQGAASNTIEGIRIINADAVTFQYGIQLAWLPTKAAAGAFIKKARPKVDVSAMFITQAKDGFRIYYEGFNNFGAAKKVLKRIRQSFKDAFIKKIK